MRICFALPCTGRRPLGGLRIIYEHANRLAAKGHIVTLLHVLSASRPQLNIRRFAIGQARFWRDRLTSGYRPDSWFALDDNITTTWHLTLRPEFFPQGDIVIATGWQTAEAVAALAPSCGRKFYFIQHYETWDCPEPRLRSTWALPLRKIVIARWLLDLAKDMGEQCDYVPNAIDLDFFETRREPASRVPQSILLQSHHKDWKGTEDALEALRLVKQRGIDFDLQMFGMKVPDSAGDLTQRQFIYNPKQDHLRDLYNEAAIFVSASWAEGWGLTPHEAAACGAALVVSDVGGHREFLQPEQSALMSPPKHPATLADNICRLLANDTLRIRLAHSAQAAVQPFTWDRSSDAFTEALLN